MGQGRLCGRRPTILREDCKQSCNVEQVSQRPLLSSSGNRNCKAAAIWWPGARRVSLVPPYDFKHAIFPIENSARVACRGAVFNFSEKAGPPWAALALRGCRVG